MIEYFPFVLSLSKHDFSFFSTLLGLCLFRQRDLPSGILAPEFKLSVRPIHEDAENRKLRRKFYLNR